MRSYRVLEVRALIATTTVRSLRPPPPPPSIPPPPPPPEDAISGGVEGGGDGGWQCRAWERSSTLYGRRVHDDHPRRRNRKVFPDATGDCCIGHSDCCCYCTAAAAIVAVAVVGGRAVVAETSKSPSISCFETVKSRWSCIGRRARRGKDEEEDDASSSAR